MTRRSPGLIFAPAAFLIACLLGTLALMPASAAVGTSSTERAVAKVLNGRGLTVVGTNCKEKRTGSYACRWRAMRVIADWPYDCQGKAWTTRRNRLRVSRCELSAPAEAPVSPTPVSNPAFGVNETWYFHRKDLPLAALAGVEMGRYVVPWAVVESKQGHFWWVSSDLTYSAMLLAGIRPLIVLKEAPCWAAISCVENGSVLYPAEAYEEDWSAFVAAVARRYPEAAAIEVWNEPNYAVYGGGPPDPERYAEILALSYTAIKAANPAMKVISAGLASFTVDDLAAGRMSAETFLRRAYEAGGIRDHSDGVGYHAYGWLPTGLYLRSIRTQLAAVRGAMVSGGDAAKPLWITETGLASDVEAEAERAEGSAEVLEQFRRIPGIEVTIFHRWADQTGGGIESWSGMVGTDGDAKPILCALAKLRGGSCKLLDLEL